jgi:hypothetical protein
VFVYLPLAGENRDDDEKGERGSAEQPHERLEGKAGLRDRHRPPTLPLRAQGVKCDKRTKSLTADAARVTLLRPMPRAAIASDPKPILLLDAVRFQLR